MIWTLIAHVTTFLNLAKQQAEIPVVTIYGKSPSLVRHKSCGTPRSAHGYALIMPVCVTESLYQQRQVREESNEKEVRVRARLSVLGSTVDLISRSSLHTTGFLLGLFWTMSNLGKDCEAIIYIYIYLSCSLPWARKATLILLSKAGDNTASLTLGDTQLGILPES